MPTHIMQTLLRRRVAPTFLAALLSVAAGCDKTLTVEPTTQVEETQAIIDGPSARAALAGAYDALQDGSYYGGDFLFITDLASDDVAHVGTFTTFADVDQAVTAADNSTLEGIWDAIYIAIGRANTLIAKIPAVTQLSDDERKDIVGQAHLIRALSYHNLVKLWGPVPIRLAPPVSLNELANTERATVAQVYTQILADINQASQLLSSDFRTTSASYVAAEAIKSRVLLYQGNWAATVTAADKVIDEGLELAPSFSSLFQPQSETPEDIWRVAFTATEYNLSGYYYLSKALGGRYEIAPTASLNNAYESGDERLSWSIQRDSRNRRFGAKWRTTEGAEDLHVIRFAEVLLNKAEAQAMLGDLDGAVTTYNELRVRAGLAPHQLGVDVSSQTEVRNAVWLERRRELAFEGDRWADLVRTQRAATVLNIPSFRTLFPIPQNEIDVAPKIIQNSGY
ncbi:MAG: RagB/SusD family nutrient uptake outer membrane protein [Gemmatimonadaceae bacterium]|nr:RagB/SusD family nutrient uptake outer membrane protein [Gemmatimonadaceae bacterium]